MKFVLFVTLIWSILDSGWSITDEEYIQFKAGLSQIQVLNQEVKDLRNENQAGQKQVQVLTREVQDLKNENQDLRKENHNLRNEVQDLRNENRAGQKQVQVLMTEVHDLKTENIQLRLRVEHLEETCGVDSQQDPAQNTTIEERVTILEGEMIIVQIEVAELEDDVDGLEDQQIIQDEKILNVEDRTFILEQELTDLDTRVEVLEANGGGGGNVTALEVKVETLEGTAAEHESDIADLESTASNLDGRVETLEGETSELETRLTAAETLIEDLQAADVGLDSRITDLEEGGGGNSNDTIAFYAVMDTGDDDNIPDDSTVIFSDVQLNAGNGYDAATGVFTVPPGGAGYYYFSTCFRVYFSEYAWINLQVNGITVCIFHEDTQLATDWDNAGCSATVFLQEGDEVKNVYTNGADSTPVYGDSYSGFTGFRI